MRICFFGDSFVNGFGDPHFQGWVGRVCESARARGDQITAYNCGIRRATSDDVRATWFAEATARLPAAHKSAVVFSFGANDRRFEDGSPRVPISRQLENTRAILTAAAGRWPTLFVASPRMNDESPDSAALPRTEGVRDICRVLGVAFLDAYAASAAFQHWFREASAGDGVHPGAGGYGELAALVDQWAEWRKLVEKLRE